MTQNKQKMTHSKYALGQLTKAVYLSFTPKFDTPACTLD